MAKYLFLSGCLLLFCLPILAISPNKPVTKSSASKDTTSLSQNIFLFLKECDIDIDTLQLNNIRQNSKDSFDDFNSEDEMSLEFDTGDEISFEDVERLYSHMAELDSIIAANGTIDISMVPAANLYNSWVNHIVNPYKIDASQKKDTTISLAGYTYPLDELRHITSKFGFRRYRFHYGTDIKLYVGDSVRTAFDGMVRIVLYNRRGYGHYVVIRHFNGLETVYAHLSKPLVKVNQTIKSGEVLGLGGNTGTSTGSHLHFEVRYLGQPINPEDIIDFNLGVVKQPQLAINSTNFNYQKQIAQTNVYVVRKGDTLGHIARRYGVSINQICRNNNIKPTSVLRIGQRLKI